MEWWEVGEWIGDVAGDGKCWKIGEQDRGVGDHELEVAEWVVGDDELGVTEWKWWME